MEKENVITKIQKLLKLQYGAEKIGSTGEAYQRVSGKMFVIGTEDNVAIVQEFYNYLEKVNPRFLRKKKGCKYVYVPALRYKEGKELDAAFREFAKEHEVTEEPLNEYGIHMVDWKKGMSYSIQLAHDTQKDLYMLVCSNSIPEAFDKQKIAKDQFEIEY